jgi:hypothetical protein
MTWKDCSTCKKYDRSVCTCEIHGYGSIVSGKYKECGEYDKR